MAHLPRWRNWYTRTFEGRMRQLIRVQVPAWAPFALHATADSRRSFLVRRRILAHGRLAQLVRAPRLHRGSHWFESSTAHHRAIRGRFAVRPRSGRFAPSRQLDGTRARALAVRLSDPATRAPPSSVRAGEDTQQWDDRGVIPRRDLEKSVGQDENRHNGER